MIDSSRAGGPRFFGYVLGSGEPVAAAADLLASVLNQTVTAWRSSPSAVTLERVVVGWLAEAIGCAGFRGSLTGGGSPANLMGLAMAREARLPANESGARPGTIYASQEVHMSIPKAIALLGIGREHLRLIECDDKFRIRTDLLRSAIERDVSAGIVPIAIVGSAGTVTTGSIDPLRELAEIARAYGAWFHVDGAYGALAAIAEPQMFEGLDQADSISLDPHKWLYQPLDCGCLLYRDAAAARRAFSYTGDYAKSLLDDPVEGFAFFDESIELSRRFRALKVWLSLRYHGFAAFREAIRNDLAMAQHLAQLIRNESAAGIAGAGDAQRRLFPVSCRSGFGHVESDDTATRNPARECILVERQRAWPVRAAGLRREPPHDPCRRRAGCQRGDCCGTRTNSEGRTINHANRSAIHVLSRG